MFEDSSYSNGRGFFVFLFGFGGFSLVVFCCWLDLGFFYFWGVVGVGVNFSLGGDDIQIRRNVYFMAFWYAVLQFKVSKFSLVQWLSRVRLCNPMNHSTPGLPVHHQLPEFTQTHVHPVGDAIQPSHPLSSPSPPAPNPSQHQGLFQ